MKQVPCMIDGNHCLIKGLLTIDQKGWWLYGYIDVCGNYLLVPCLKNRVRSFKAFLQQNRRIFECGE